MDYSTVISSYFPFRSLKLAPEIKVMSLVAGMEYPVQITNDNAPYALPYWHSQALARYILDNPTLFTGRRVLDIGCGCGAASIAAAKVGAIATALDPNLLCLEFTERNAKLNNVSVNVVWGDHTTQVDTDILIAGGIFHEAYGLQVAKVASTIPSLIALSRYNVRNITGFKEVSSYKLDHSLIHVFKSEHL